MRSRWLWRSSWRPAWPCRQPRQGQGTTSIVLLHTSDYHSHARPHYADGEYGVGGLARVIQYLRDEKAANPNTVILGGGDTMNLGTPAWSDKYQCAEWPLFNGLQDAMAFGNHEADYGWDALRAVPRQRHLPDPERRLRRRDQRADPPALDRPRAGRDQARGLRAGRQRLREARSSRPIGRRAHGSSMAEKVAPAIILHLRQVEKVDAVVSIGHRFYEEDVKLAQDVPGIDVILGTHSHRKEDLKQIPGTNTWIISPFQYLEYVSRVELTFEDGRLATVGGGLVRMGPDRPEAPDVAEQVRGDAAGPGGRSAVRGPLRAAGAGGGRALRRQHQQRRVGARQLGPGHGAGGGRRPGRRSRRPAASAPRSRPATSRSRTT